MFSRYAIFSVLAAAALSGCSVFTDARRAQDEVETKGRGTADASSKVFDLRGRTLSWLVDFALTNRPGVVAARLAVQDARLLLKALAADAPVVSSTPWTSANVSASGGFDVASEQSRHLDGIEFSSDGTFSGSISLNVLIYDFGRYGARAAEAAENLVAAEVAMAETGFTVFEEVSGAYFTVHEKSALLEVARTNEFEYAEHLRRAQDLLEAGEAQNLDVTRAKLDLSQARERTVAASNDVTTALAELMCALGVEIGCGNSRDLLPADGEALGAVWRAFADTGYSAADAFACARTNAPATAVARARLRAASSRVDYALADLLPEVSAGTSLGWTDPMWIWRGGVSVAQSIFQGWRKTVAVDRAVVAMRSAAAGVDEAEQKLSRSLELAVAERDNAVKAHETAAASLVDARENLKTVKAQYLEGDADRIDFTSSVSDYTTALGSRISAFYRGQTAEAKLFRATGRTPVWAEKRITEVE
jgi:outer membrane protein TolC